MEAFRSGHFGFDDKTIAGVGLEEEEGIVRVVDNKAVELIVRQNAQGGFSSSASKSEYSNHAHVAGGRGYGCGQSNSIERMLTMNTFDEKTIFSLKGPHTERAPPGAGCF